MLDDVLIWAAESQPEELQPVFERLYKRHRADVLDSVAAIVRANGHVKDEREPLKILRAGEFLIEVGKPPPMLVDRILPDKSLILLTGKPKSGKSLAGIDLLWSVCTGGKVWGEFAVNRAGPVIYFGMEDGQYEIANRLLKRGVKPGDEHGFYVCTQRFGMSAPEDAQLLREALEKLGIRPSLIMVDTATEALGIREWNERAEVSDKVRPLRDFAREVCSVLLVAHNRKADAIDSGDEIAGSNAFTGAVDGWLSVQRVEKGENHHRLHIRADGRGGMRDQIVAEMDLATLAWRALDERDVAELHKQERERRKQDRCRLILRTVHKLTAAAVSAICDETEMNYKEVQQLAVEMVDRGWLETERGKSNGAGRPSTLYKVTEAGVAVMGGQQKMMGLSDDSEAL